MYAELILEIGTLPTLESVESRTRAKQLNSELFADPAYRIGTLYKC